MHAAPTPTANAADHAAIHPVPARKLRVAIMGEFSAGKSTLANLLLGMRPLPAQVTATRLSPVWISLGHPAAEREMLDGRRVPVALDAISQVPVEDTRVIRLFVEADVLEFMDLIDCPGISDPNMPPDVWERLVPDIDAVIWCSHATQAWRQSEAAVWEAMPDHVRARSLLLLTRIDKILTDRDRGRVLARVRNETAGKFAAVVPVSLTQALGAGDNAAVWESSGGAALIAHLTDLVTAAEAPVVPGQAARAEGSRAMAAPAALATAAVAATRAVAHRVAPADDASETEPKVQPRRVRPAATRAPRRPAAGSAVRPLRLVPPDAETDEAATDLDATARLRQGFLDP